MKKYLLENTDELLDWTKWRLNIFTDSNLASALGTSPSTISKIRRGHLPLGDRLLVRILYDTDTNIRELPKLISSTKHFWS